MRGKIFLILALAALAAGALLLARLNQPRTATPTAPAPPARAPILVPDAPFEETDWFALVPRDWEPGKTFGADIARLSDKDPRAIDALEKLRAAWADAPVEPAMAGARIRIGGFVIPLDTDNGAVTEFLLVPYFGACIHAPPPPANQVIHVFARRPLRHLTMMHPVYVSGTLRVARDKTPGSAAGLIDTIGYEMDLEKVAPYKLD
ncbi:DUF3299 domain-containing protein [Massilia sp. S19_KUP03_FR1]|uniref:DUF3299 domain-containing protein n=1 Tax=Massilia sp. S19_KUP03_FR1 TaxID=3025503 RepID=UPI002FCD8C18